MRKLIFVKVQSLETPMNHDALMSQSVLVAVTPGLGTAVPAMMTGNRRPLLTLNGN